MNTTLLAVASCRASVALLRPARRVLAPALLALLAANASAQIVARVALEAPEEDTFLLRATLPVPPGTYVLPASTVPLRVVGPDGVSVPTQLEAVSHYANLADGADVVEVIARVTRPAGAAPGDSITYAIRASPHTPGAFATSAAVEALLHDADGLRIISADAHANTYRADLLEDVRNLSAKRVKDGRFLRQFKVHEVLAPDNPQSGPHATLPHLMGVHAYVTLFSDADYFAVDLHVHNGLVGLDANDALDDTLGELFFDRLTLRVPEGWSILQAYETPFLSDMHPAGNGTARALISSLPNGKLHYMPRQSRFVRRLMISTDAAHDEARSVLEHRHLAFCLPGTGGAGALWSWWNASTARYFPQKFRLPTLDHAGLNNIAAELEGEFEAVRSQVASGDPGGYPFYSPVLGWAQPWGVAYGGMAGGDEINLVDGLRTAASGARDGYRLHEIVSARYMDRQPNCLYKASGDPVCLDDILVTAGFGAPYSPSTFSASLLPNATQDFFGFGSAPDQLFVVRDSLRMPDYYGELKKWEPILLSHMVRYTRTFKTLAWLGNDTLAKDQLHAVAELFHLYYHEFPNSSYGYVQGSGLLKREQYVDVHPHVGLDFRREEAWGLDATVAAYGFGERPYRESIYPWLERVFQVVQDGQSDCTGNIMASDIWVELDGRFKVRHGREVAFVDQALRSLAETVFRGVDDARAAEVETVMLRSVSASIEPPFWSPEQNGPWVVVGTGSYNPDLTPDMCYGLPAHAHGPETDHSTYWNSFAYAYHASGDALFLARALEMGPNQDFIQDFIAAGTFEVEKRAALLAVWQELAAERE